MKPEENLSALINLEKDKISEALGQSKTPFLDLITILRQLDLLYISIKSGGQSDTHLVESLLEYYRYGWFEALNVYLTRIDGKESPLIFPSNRDAQLWADSVLNVSGKIEMAKRYIDLMNAGLITIEQEGTNTFKVKFIHEIIEKENFDRASFEFVQKLNLTIVKEKYEKHQRSFKKIKKQLGSIIKNPAGEYLAYEATENIENYYNDTGYFHLLSEQKYEDFGEDDQFGGISYKQYLDCVQDIYSGALLHVDCCQALMNINPSVNPYNIFTYTWHLDKTVNGYADHFGLSVEAASQIISCLTLSVENLSFYKGLRGAIPPPYIKTGANQITRLICGSLQGSVDFLKRELKRKYEKDYFKAVNKREKRFRNDVYQFFPQDRFVKIDTEIILKYQDLHTDIDAVIYDLKTHSLGLFQLKWQDMFYSSPTERFSRISNLFPKATEWIDKVEKWIKSYNEEEVIQKLKLTQNNSVTTIGEVFLFIVARNHVHFTGVEPDPRAAWATINQIPYSLSRIQTSLDDPIRELHLKLKMDDPEERVKREGYPVAAPFKIELESFTVYH